MAYVNEVEVSEAEPRLKSIYERLQKMLGYVPHYFQSLGAKPEVIEAQLAMDSAIMGEGALSTSIKEQIGLVVSGINSSAYCIAFHMELLNKGFGLPKPVAKKLAVDYENAPGDEKTKVLFRFADKLTRRAGAMTRCGRRFLLWLTSTISIAFRLGWDWWGICRPEISWPASADVFVKW